MVSGGHGRTGRVADPNSLRSASRQDEWTTLPAEGCSDPAPVWPLATESDREVELWARLWEMPQASQWVRLHLTDEVALYCRYFAEAEVSQGNREARTLVRQHRELLGLSTAGLERLKWRMAPDQVAERRVADAAPVRASVRDRLKAVQGGS